MVALPDNLRWYGWAAVLGGVLFAASDFAARLLDAALDGGGAQAGGYALWTTLSLLSLALLQLALVGLYSPHRQTAGPLGWVGFFLASPGIAFAFLIVLVYAVAASPLPSDAPELLRTGPPAMFLLYFPLFSVGWVLLGAAFLKVPFYPRWAIRLLGFGAVIALHPNPLTTVVFGAAVAWLGLALIQGDAPTERTRHRLPPHSENRDALVAPTYFLVGRRVGKGTEERLTLLSQITSDGERVVLAFEEAEAAEAFRIIEDLGPEWEVLGALQEVTSLLRSAAQGEVRYVALDPPSALRREEEELRLVPIMAFVDHLMGK